MNYMERPEEKVKHADQMSSLARLAGGDKTVLAAMWSLWNFGHCWDDLLDESDWPADRKELAWKALHDYTVDLLLNPFVRANAAEIRGFLVSAMARCLDGDKMAADNDPGVSGLSPAVRCGDVDLLLHLAYLRGGWGALRELSSERVYDDPDKKGES